MLAESVKRRDDYKKFHEQLGRCFKIASINLLPALRAARQVLKLGVHEPAANRAKVAELLRDRTSKTGQEPTSDKEYVDRMKDRGTNKDIVTEGLDMFAEVAE